MVNAASSDQRSDEAAAPFGSVLGHAPGGVAAYSSDYPSVDERLMPDRRAFRSYLDGIYMGHKWQCVEFARRFMYLSRGWIFDDVAMAYEIFRLRTIRDVRKQRLLPLRAFANGSVRRPEAGSLLVWRAGGEFARTGHVAVVTEVLNDRVRVAEQNVDHRRWPTGHDYAREIPARVDAEGRFWLGCTYPDTSVQGWVVQTDEEDGAEPPVEVDPRLFAIVAGQAPGGGDDGTWLDLRNPAEAAFVAAQGHTLATSAAHQGRYHLISETAHAELTRATNELHALFLHATEHVLADDGLLERFNLPHAIWPRIRQSWSNRRNQMISGRFDFAMTARGPRVYEYNCDSASCHLETARLQGKWAHHHGCSLGRDPGQNLLADLTAAWRASGVDGVLHILIDNDLEETYHARFMQEAVAAAGIESTIVTGLGSLGWADDGSVVDGDGVPIRWVWKTWAWETALDQIRAEIEDEENGSRDGAQDVAARKRPRLVDVLLRPEVTVFEPLWTLIPSNKAILPVLWQLFPDHPYLLNASFELDDRIRASGYVQKPIRGRRGANISIFDAHERLIEETDGRFPEPHQIVQELCELPQVAGDRVQICTFSVAGTHAGTCVRVDPSLVITANSDLVALRVIHDDELRDRLAAETRT